MGVGKSNRGEQGSNDGKDGGSCLMAFIVSSRVNCVIEAEGARASSKGVFTQESA